MLVLLRLRSPPAFKCKEAFNIGREKGVCGCVLYPYILPSFLLQPLCLLSRLDLVESEPSAKALLLLFLLLLLIIRSSLDEGGSLSSSSSS